MLYVFKLGPIDSHEGPFSAFVGLTKDEALPPILGGSPAEALEAIAAQAGEHDLRCEASLGRAGKRSGFVSAPVPEWACVPRAMLAFALALGNTGNGLFGAPLPEFLAAASEYMKTRPWRHWRNDDLVEINVSGLRKQFYEGSIMGAGGQEYGLALYEGAGSMARVRSMMDQGRRRDAAMVPAIAVTRDDEPRWAVKPLKDAFDLNCLPIPMRVTKGAPPLAPRPAARCSTQRCWNGPGASRHSSPRVVRCGPASNLDFAA